jgi:hypothetical protein
VHLFWSSHEEEQASLELPWESSHGWSWSCMAGHGELTREVGEGRGEGAEGKLGGAQPLLHRAASLFGPLRAKREVEENEEREKKRKRKEKKKMWKIFQT